MEEVLIKLKAPFPVEKLSWRIGQKSNWDVVKKCPKDPNKPVKAMMLVYIDARDVQDRLDEVCGSHWENEFKTVNGRTTCRITINGMSREDGAGDTDFEAEKGGLSDAFKRAAVQWGVGRYLYDAKNYNTWVDCTDMKDFDVYKNNKEQLDAVAALLGRDYILYPYFLEKIDNCRYMAEILYIKEEARKYAKREQWNQGQLTTFKEHCDKKEKELKEEKDEQCDVQKQKD